MCCSSCSGRLRETPMPGGVFTRILAPPYLVLATRWGIRRLGGVDGAELKMAQRWCGARVRPSTAPQPCGDLPVSGFEARYDQQLETWPLKRDAPETHLRTTGGGSKR